MGCDLNGAGEPGGDQMWQWLVGPSGKVFILTAAAWYLTVFNESRCDNISFMILKIIPQHGKQTGGE